LKEAGAEDSRAGLPVRDVESGVTEEAGMGWTVRRPGYQLTFFHAHRV
jgi:hypothetical protein